MNYRIIYRDELYHHGVKGMKWGVRKDPSSTASGGEKKRKMSTGQKVAIGVAAVAVTGVVLYKTGSFDKIADVGRRAANRHKANKLGMKVIENPKIANSSSNFDDAMSRMNSAFNSGRLSSKNGGITANKSPNSLDHLPLRLRHVPDVQKGPTSGYAKDRFGETIYRTNSPKLTKASKHLMTPYGASIESAASYHQKADKLSSDLFNNRVADANLSRVVGNKKRFDSKGDRAAKIASDLRKSMMDDGKLPVAWSKRKPSSLKSNKSRAVGRTAFDKIQSSKSYKNLTYADLEKLDLF